VKERPRRAPNWAMVFNHLPDEASIMATYHQLAKRYHPDNGGSTEIMQAINAARDAALMDLKNPAPPSPDVEEEEEGGKEEAQEEQKEEGYEEEWHEEEWHEQEEQEFAAAPVLAHPKKLAVTLAAVLLTSFILFLIYTVALPPLTNQPRLQSTNLPQAQPLPGSSGCVIWNIEHTHCRRYQWLDSATTTQESAPIISPLQIPEKAAIKLKEGQESITPTPPQIRESFDDAVIGSVGPTLQIPQMPDTPETQSASRTKAPAAQTPSSIAVSQAMADWYNEIAIMLQSKGRSIRMTLPRHGTVVVSFTVDRNGHMLENHIQQKLRFPLA
jgi:hypothetical protein